MNFVTNKFRSLVGVKDATAIEIPVTCAIHYLKDTPGLPAQNGLEGEYLLNTVDNALYRFDGTKWEAFVVDFSMRFLFSERGSVDSGNGRNIPDMMIYQQELDNTYSKKYASDGVIVLIKNKSLHQDANSLKVYKQDTNEWISISSSGGGGGGGYVHEEGEGINLSYDSNDVLTVSCELAESGEKEIANKGIANYTEENFVIQDGFVTIEKIDGGPFERWLSVNSNQNFIWHMPENTQSYVLNSAINGSNSHYVCGLPFTIDVVTDTVAFGYIGTDDPNSPCDVLSNPGNNIAGCVKITCSDTIEKVRIAYTDAPEQTFLNVQSERIYFFNGIKTVAYIEFTATKTPVDITKIEFGEIS